MVWATERTRTVAMMEFRRSKQVSCVPALRAANGSALAALSINMGEDLGGQLGSTVGAVDLTVVGGDERCVAGQIHHQLPHHSVNGRKFGPIVLADVRDDLVDPVVVGVDE